MKRQINISVEDNTIKDFNKLGLNRSEVCEVALRLKVMDSLGEVIPEKDLIQCNKCKITLNNSKQYSFKNKVFCRDCYMSLSKEEITELMKK